jgi:peptidoglycan/LPS O-acetylase OafA/YrhL
MFSPSLTLDRDFPPKTEVRQTTTRAVRTDIQVMRALAILLVLIHHAGFPYLPGGFLGVDVFFVISGFLMTGLIDEGLENGRFTFASFYARRIRRLLPAAYATLVVVALVAPWVVDSWEYRSFTMQLAGSFGFVGNMVLWKQADYFSTGAALKPLLHMWSLSVEEQFYIALPLVLWLCPARRRLPLVTALTLISAVLCLWLVQHVPSAAFYFLPTRAWELGIGSIAALVVRRGMLPAQPSIGLRIVCALLVVLVPLFANEAGHPSWAAVTVCLATGILVLPGLDLDARRWRTLTLIGDRSYSLYLVHWPVYAFANNIVIGAVPGWVNAGLILLCLLWTELQYRLVEQRFRTFPLDRRRGAMLVLVPILAIGATLLTARGMTTPETVTRARNSGLASVCDYGTAFLDLPACRTAKEARTMVWGDSYAMAVTQGLAASSPQGVVQATKTVCAPLLGISLMDGGQYPRNWAEGCIAFNRSVVFYLEHHPEIQTVVLVSAMVNYIPGAEEAERTFLVDRDGGAIEQRRSVALMLQSLDTTVRKLRAMGKRVILFAPPPSIGADMARCLDRQRGGLPTSSPWPGCSFTRADYLAQRRPVLDYLKQARQIAPVLSLDDELCRSGRCATHLNGVILYRDKGHLSTAGSHLLGQQMSWGEMVVQAAR